ncbi:multiple epidermal growth factor-like domains protein 10 isoform X2 [Mercenaria mercenaria]|uniref:multiple epidermal growth factor-like domains protein 10 isoform X2 n=1 Tax=Mercenaria mercenaria TaxID=6596 RepID=UPI00234ED736|nr:multiple epidermal growth factor-like domains protein 10 isoform X2 [Mercenaria mercenaria]
MFIRKLMMHIIQKMKVALLVCLFGTFSAANEAKCSKQGYGGPNCTFECPSNCMFPSENDTDTCNYTTGECLHGCNQGYAGQNCSVECPQNCAPSGNSGDELCSATFTQCLFGCNEGFYGPNCTNYCTDKDSNCKRCTENDGNSGVVCNECSKNFYRGSGKCIQCSYWCQKLPSPSPQCRENDGYCNYGCKNSRFGFKCGSRCSNTCESSCHRDSGKCDGCKYTSYCGPTCEIACQDGCALQQCNQSCDCIKGCNIDRWGRKCVNQCSENCFRPQDVDSRICNHSDGTCLYGCKNNKYWGDECDVSCSDGCLNGTCQQESGNCTVGCTSKTVHGLRCDTVCSENCLNGTCERADGYCDDGCNIGSYGERCDITCNRNCISGKCKRENGFCDNGCEAGNYGDQCDLGCSYKCLNNRCKRTDGNCTDGCISGYEGPFCEKVDEANIIYYYIEETSVVNKTLVGVAVSAWLLLLVVLAVKVIRRRYHIKRKETANEERIPPVRDQYECMTSQREQRDTADAANYEVLAHEGGKNRDNFL